VVVVAGLEVVVVGAEGVEFVEGGVVGGGPVDAVVGFQAGLGVAAEGDAFGVAPVECGVSQGGGWRPRWTIARMSVSLVTMAARNASFMQSWAMAAGTGPMPAISQVSPVWGVAAA